MASRRAPSRCCATRTLLPGWPAVRRGHATGCRVRTRSRRCLLVRKGWQRGGTLVGPAYGAVVQQISSASRSLFGPLIAVGMAIVIASVLVRADVPRTKADADQMLQKIAMIATNGLSERPAARSTTVTGRELNSFPPTHPRKDPPAGVLDPA